MHIWGNLAFASTRSKTDESVSFAIDDQLGPGRPASREVPVVLVPKFVVAAFMQPLVLCTFAAISLAHSREVRPSKVSNNAENV